MRVHQACCDSSRTFPLAVVTSSSQVSSLRASAGEGRPGTKANGRAAGQRGGTEPGPEWAAWDGGGGQMS